MQGMVKTELRTIVNMNGFILTSYPSSEIADFSCGETVLSETYANLVFKDMIKRRPDRLSSPPLFSLLSLRSHL